MIVGQIHTIQNAVTLMENYTKLNSKPVVEELKEPWDIYVGSGSKVKAVINKALKTLEVNTCTTILILPA